MISPHETHTKWSWWSRFQTGSKRASPPRSELAREPGLLEELQRPVDRGAPDLGVAAAHDLQQVLDRDVVPGLHEGVEDRLALRAALEVVAREVRGEDLALFATGGQESWRKRD